MTQVKSSNAPEAQSVRQAKRDLVWMLLAVVLFVGLSAGAMLWMNRTPTVRDPLNPDDLPAGQQPLALTIAHTNDTWGYIEGCG